MSLFQPDFRFSSFREIDEQFLDEHPFRALILDIDNTLEPYENPVPGADVLSWFEMLGKHGVKCAFVSNNNAERVELFNKELGFPAFPKSGKPFAKNLRLAMKLMGVRAEETLAVGDQIFTDVWAGHNAKVKCALVPPIKDKTDLLTRSKRLLEKPILRRYEKRKGKSK